MAVKRRRTLDRSRSVSDRPPGRSRSVSDRPPGRSRSVRALTTRSVSGDSPLESSAGTSDKLAIYEFRLTLHVEREGDGRRRLLHIGPMDGADSPAERFLLSLVLAYERGAPRVAAGAVDIEVDPPGSIPSRVDPADGEAAGDVPAELPAADRAPAPGPVSRACLAALVAECALALAGRAQAAAPPDAPGGSRAAAARAAVRAHLQALMHANPVSIESEYQECALVG